MTNTLAYLSTAFWSIYPLIFLTRFNTRYASTFSVLITSALVLIHGITFNSLIKWMWGINPLDGWFVAVRLGSIGVFVIITVFAPDNVKRRIF